MSLTSYDLHKKDVVSFEITGAQYKGAKRRMMKLAFRAGIGAEIRQERNRVVVKLCGNREDLAVFEETLPKKLTGCALKRVIDPGSTNVTIDVHRISETGTDNAIPSTDFDSWSDCHILLSRLLVHIEAGSLTRHLQEETAWNT